MWHNKGTMRGREDGQPRVRHEVAVAACDTAALVRVSAQFADLGLEFARQPDITAAQVAMEKADWTAVGAALGQLLQALQDRDNPAFQNAMREIDRVLSRHGVLVPRPTPPPTQEVRDGE